MAAPTTPYSTPAQAAYLMQNMFRGVVPSGTTPVTSTVLAQLITWVDSVIDSDFAAVGYILPFVAVSGETWPTHQTAFLGFMSATGAAAMASGHILKPAPAMSMGQQGGDQNVYAVMFNKFRTDIDKSGFHFRAQYYAGTKAEKWIATPYGPRMDFWPSDLYDPTQYELTRAYTNRMHELFSDVKDMDIDWDYMYALRDSSQA